MRRRRLGWVVAAGLFAAGTWSYFWIPEPTILAFRVGQPFEEVVRHSTFPVMARSNLPADDSRGFGATWVQEPAVIICFDDPEHGFILPPTKFAALTYTHNTAAVLSTSPMLEKLPFDEAVAVLENLQNQFKAGGWQPWEVDGSVWFDLSPGGKQRLYARMLEPGYMQTAVLRVPKKYGMIFRFWCAEGCWTREPPYRFLIDLGVSEDLEGKKPGDPQVWDKAFPAPAPGTRSRCPRPDAGAQSR